jgi:hypothetical protein
MTARPSYETSCDGDITGADDDDVMILFEVFLTPFS